VNLIEKITWYWQNKGVRGLVRRIVKGRESALHHMLGQEQRSAGMTPSAADLRAIAADTLDVRALIKRSYAPIQPLPVYSAPGPSARINLVTDSINSGSLFGGVATAIILSVLLAKRTGAKLRVVTRTEAPDASGFAHVLECNGIKYVDDVEFVQVGVSDERAQLDVCEGDRFLTTSWWTTACVLGSIPPSRIDYLLQEDERMFYPHGDDWLRCQEVLMREDIRFIINTEMLLRHFTSTGLEHMASHAMWFEPAFPNQILRAPNPGNEQRLKFFFYARPNNLRNLFYRGIEVLDEVVAEGILDPKSWDVYFVGKDVPKLRLGGVLEPIVLPTMEWRDYSAFIASIDLGLCLMATPHPSYPPLDLAVTGALVVTNQFGVKRDLQNYSSRIICVQPDAKSLKEGLRAMIVRAEAEQKTGRPSGKHHHLSTSWETSLAAIVEQLR